MANRFVDLTPGPGTAEIKDGDVLRTSETRPIVDLDELLNALDPPTRARLQSLIQSSGEIFAGRAASDANELFATLDPAASPLASLSAELAADGRAVDRLITGASSIAGVLADTRGDAGTRGRQHVGDAARARRRASGARQRPCAGAGPLRQADATLGRLRTTLGALRPALREAQPSARPFATVIDRLAPTARDAIPALRDLRAALPKLREALAGLPALARVAVPAVRSTTSARSPR